MTQVFVSAISDQSESLMSDKSRASHPLRRNAVWEGIGSLKRGCRGNPSYSRFVFVLSTIWRINYFVLNEVFWRVSFLCVSAFGSDKPDCGCLFKSYEGWSKRTTSSAMNEDLLSQIKEIKVSSSHIQCLNNTTKVKLKWNRSCYSRIFIWVVLQFTLAELMTLPGSLKCRVMFKPVLQPTTPQRGVKPAPHYIHIFVHLADSHLQWRRECPVCQRGLQLQFMCFDKNSAASRAAHLLCFVRVFHFKVPHIKLPHLVPQSQHLKTSIIKSD